MKSFLNACGVKDSLRLVVDGPEAKRDEVRWFPQPFVVIGRDPRVDLVLDDPQISRRHVYLQAVGGWLFWVDLESRTGIRTEEGLLKSGWLTANGFLGLGPYTIRCRDTAKETADESALGEPPWDLPLAALSSSQEPLPEVALEFLNGPSKSTIWPMHRVMSMIGSAKCCKFRLTDRSVAAVHASLLRTPTGVWIVDLRGGHSISVNGLPTRCSELIEGDVLSIGRYQIRIRCRDRVQRFTGGATDPAREEPTGGLAWQMNRGPEPLGLPLPDRAGRAIVPLAASGTTQGPPASFQALVSHLEPMASGAHLSGLMSQPEVCDPALMPLVNQFGIMQQQMFDQFQQAMGMLVQMFGTMHREQMDVIREELDRLHQLSKELQDLKDELAKPSRQPVAASGELAASTSPLVPPPSIPTTPVPGRTSPIPTLAAAIPTPAAAPVAEPTSPVIAKARTSAQPERDAVAWIHQRILTIQSERETRWQKILKLIPGVS